MTSTRGITFASEQQRKDYLRDCRIDEMRERPAPIQRRVIEHDLTLVGMIFYLSPELKGFRLSKDGSTITSQIV